MRYLLLFFLAACSGPATTYQRGTYVSPPPAPVARPGVGAPAVGQPGARVEPPRSPHGRVLPQTPSSRRQPGIWAGDEPVEDLTPPKILEVPLPVPDDRKTRAMARRCVEQMNYALVREGFDDEAQHLEPRVRRCLAAKLYQHCAAGYIDEYNERRAAETLMDKAEEARRRAMKSKADEMVARMCPEKPPHLPVRPETIFDGTANTWTKIMRGQGPAYGD